MPDLVRLLVRHALIGFALAVLLVLCLLAFNVGGLGDLIDGPDGPVALIMLTMFTGLTFASAQMGIGVMLAGGNDDEHHPGSMLAAVAERIWKFVRDNR